MNTHPTGEAPAVAAAQPAKKRRLLDNRFLAPGLITAILLVGDQVYGITEDQASPLLKWLTGGWLDRYSPTFVAIVVSIGMELFMGRAATGRWPHLASAYISGISVGILIRSPELWPYVLCSALSIVSKYAIRYRGRHLWNPSNLGVSAMLFLAPGTVASLSFQWGNDVWPIVVIWILGSMILYRLGRLHISLTYAAAFLLLAFVRSGITGDSWTTEIGPITGPMYQLFLFFMITDPKTTTRRVWSQCVVAAIVAVVETLFRLRQEVHAPYYALFIVGPAANLIEIWWDGRHAQALPVRTESAAAAEGRAAKSA